MLTILHNKRTANRYPERMTLKDWEMERNVKLKSAMRLIRKSGHKTDKNDQNHDETETNV